MTPEAARTLHQRGQFEAAEAAYRELIEQSPGQLEISLALTYLLRDQGRRSAAAAVIIDWWKHSDQKRRNSIRVVTLLSEMDRISAAEPVINDLLHRWSQDPAVLEQAAMIAQGQGDFGRARKYLQQLLSIDSNRPGPWLRLVHGRRFSSDDDPDLLTIQSQLEDQPSPKLEIPLRFALGKILDDLGQYGAAARAWRRGNDLAATSVEQSSLPPKHTTADVVSTWPRMKPYDDERQPIFIIGMPRSGTTLLSRRLAALKGVRDRGELNWLGLLLERLPSKPAQSMLETVRHHYLAQLFQDDPPAQWYIDQNPRNFHHLAVIHHLFPNAAVIHLQRHSADTALSIWAQLFAHHDMAWSHRFETIRDEFERHQQCLDSAPRTENCISARYERLVSEPETVINELTDRLGLKAGEFDDQPGNIATASLWQARQPVHSRSVGRWERYQKYVPELKTFSSTD